jgi:lipopolysaccharide transport protein LptA
VKITRLQATLLASAALLAVVLAATFRRVPRPPREAPPPAATAQGPEGSGKPTTLLSGFDYSESAGGRTRFTVHADRTVGFAQGAGLPSTWYRLEKVALTLASDRGEPLVVHSDAAEYDPRTRAMNLSGNVVARDTQGTEVRSAAVRFDPSGSRLLMPEEVRFSRGPVSGRAASAVYGTTGRILTLVGPVTAAGSGPGAPFDTLRADGGEYRATEGEITLAGRVEGARGQDTLSCDRLTVHVLADNRVDRAVALGNVAGTLVSSGGRGRYRAAQATSTFDGSGKIAGVDLVGTPATLVVPASAGQPERRLAAPGIRLGFSGDRLAAADANGRPRLERDGVRNGAPFVESITSDTARATFAPDGSLATSRFDGNVVGVTAEGSSKSPAGSYSAATDVMTLSAAGGRDAELDGERGKLVATSIDIAAGTGLVTATGEARVFLRPGAGSDAVPTFLASGKKPTRGKARKIVLDDRSRTALLVGDAALWQDEDALFADEISLRDADRSARAQGRVRLTARSEQAPSAADPGRSTVTSARLRYSDAEKLAVFEEGVVATRGAQVARGDRAECRFDANNRLDRTILDGHVTFDDPATGRRGSGERAVDEPKAGTTNLAGNPAVAQDAQGNVVKGAVLTFRKESGSVEVKAAEGGRIESIYQTHGKR